MCNKNNGGVGYTIDRYVDAVDSRFSYSPLLNRNYGSLFHVRSAREKVLSRKNIAPSFEGHSDTRSQLDSQNITLIFAPCRPQCESTIKLLLDR
jgi:hypothetical protein